jgi:branched-chain amino acid transport system substrate-binding protein
MRTSIWRGLALLAALTAVVPARAEDTIRIGFLSPMSGFFASTGQETLAGVRAYMAEHGDHVAGKKIELLVHDDAGIPDTTRRLVQEMLTNEHVDIIAGLGLTPQVLAAAPLITKARVASVVMGAATSSVTNASPYYVRSFIAVPASSAVLADWASKSGIKTVVSIVSDYAPGYDAETWFKGPFEKAGGRVLASLRVPLMNPDYAPFLQRAADTHPDAVFVFIPAGSASSFMHQFVERGLAQAGIRLIAGGDLTDDQMLNDMGPASIGVITDYYYSAAHESPENQAFRKAFAQANPGLRPNYMAANGHDGMAMIYEALAKTKGDADGDKMMAALKGLQFVGARGPILIDPQTRDIVQNLYMRRVEQRDGELWNIEFGPVIPMVKDPAKAAD